MFCSDQKRISVIVPVYNAEETLRKCLDSLLTQAIADLEFICVDDGSKDGSWEILQEYHQKDSRFCIFSKENGGVSSARNFGLDHATGEYIMFLDSDDWYDSNTCEEALSLVEASGADVGLFCMTMEYAQKSEYRSVIGDRPATFNADTCLELHRRCVGLVGDELSDLLKFDYLSLVYLKIYRRDIIESQHIRFFDIREIGSFEDGFFNVQYLSCIRSAVYSPLTLYHYNKINQSSITTRYREKLPQQWKVLFSILQKHVESFDDSRLTGALNNRIAYAILGLGLNILSSNESRSEKRKKIREILHSEELHRSFLMSDLMKMPFPFAVFFAFSAFRWTTGVYVMLWLMGFVRNKNKGMKHE